MHGLSLDWRALLRYLAISAVVVIGLRLSLYLWLGRPADLASLWILVPIVLSIGVVQSVRQSPPADRT